MAMKTACQTNDAVFSTHVEDTGLSVEVNFGIVIPMNKREAKLLEADIHNALELVLRPYYML